MKEIGYASVSMTGQTLDAQLDQLQAASRIAAVPSKCRKIRNGLAIKAQTGSRVAARTIFLNASHVAAA
jgi:hypothetical protein